ncbi:MAG: bacillithiol biosynthesis BshC [bacterium]|nr:bacillithiol biosynthesis BshC [bacterium]
MKPVIITGQQIGLLGGPLYTTLKVLGALYHAGENGGEAVYWLETNDADFNEINHIDYLDAGGDLKKLTWDIDSQGYSCGCIEVDDALVSLLETFFTSIRQTEYTPALKETVLGCYSKGRTMAEASLKLAEVLFGHLEIRLFTPFEKEFRAHSKKILLKEAQQTAEGEQCNLFCMVGKQRKTLFKKDGGYQLRDGTMVDPDHYDLVPNVKTRNICQDSYFNAHTYVAGPGEVKYIAELDPGYKYHGVKKAAASPRMSLTLLEPAAKRIMKKRNITLEEVLETSREMLLKKVMEKTAGYDIKEVTGSANRLTGEYIENLKNLGFEPSEIKALRKILQPEIKKICGSLRAREKEKHQRLLKDTAYLSDNLQPGGKKQERVFNIIYYMNLYGGKDFINRLLENYRPPGQERETAVPNGIMEI